MKHVAKLTALLIALVLLLAACGGGGTTASPDKTDAAATTASAPAKTDAPVATQDAAPSEPDVSQAVKLTVYLLGDGTKDDEEVFAELNKRTAELINATFERKLITWADFNTKYPLVFASGEEFDLIFTSNWSFYTQQAVKGGFLELTDELLSTYAPNIAEGLPDAAWKQARIGGKIYMVPNTQKEYNHLGILIRGDLRKKHNVPEITSLEILEQYMDAVAQNETGILPMDGGSEFDKWVNSALWFTQPNGYAGATVPGYYYKLTEKDGKLIKWSDIPEYAAYLDRMADYNKRGFWSKNALNQQNRLDDNFKNGTSAMALHNIGTMIAAWRETNKNHPEWEAEVYDSMFGQYPTIRTTYLGNGMAVHAQSKNPERALMWLDTIRFDQQSYDLMMGGIEGKHWIDAGAGLSSPGPNSGDYGGFSNWGFTTEQFKRESTEQWPGYDELIKGYDSRMVDCPPFYFLFDDSQVKTETAAMTNLTLKYSKTLDFGFAPDWHKTMEEVDKQYDAAGRDKVKEQYEQQMTEFLASYNAQ